MKNILHERVHASVNTPAPTLQRGGIQVELVRSAIRGAIDGMGWATARGADKEQYNVCVATTTTTTTTTTITTTANTHANSGTSMSLNGGGAGGGDEKEVERSGEPRGEDKGDEKEARREEKGG